MGRGSYKARHIVVAGEQVSWEVTDGGRFVCDIGGERVSADSLTKLEEAARAVAQRQKVTVSIPVAVVFGKRYGRDGDDAMNVTLTGRNRRTHDVTSRKEDGKAYDVNSLDHVYRPFTEKEIDTFRALAQAVENAEDARDDFLKARRLPDKAGVLVDRAIEKAQAKAS